MVFLHCFTLRKFCFNSLVNCVIILFCNRNGSFKYAYEGDNKRAALVQFMHNPSAPQVKVKEPDWSESNTDIVHLNTANFDAVLKDAASVLVMFYAPCKLLDISNC